MDTVGPYADFGACKQSLNKKFGSETKAQKLCEMVEKQYRGAGRTLSANYFGSAKELEDFLESRKTMEFDRNGELYMKHFLIDRTMSGNRWGIDPPDVPLLLDNAESGIIGKPVVLYQNTGLEPDEYVPELKSNIKRIVGEYDHPPMNDNNLSHLLAMQEPYRIGSHKQFIENGDQYWALSHITDGGVKRAVLNQPELPFFVSPCIYTLEQKPPYKQLYYLHTAIVDQPAFGVKKANVSAVCTGEATTCMLHLKKASVNLASKAGLDLNKGCPFCTEKAMKRIGENVKRAGIADIAQSRITGFSSQLTKSASFNTDKKVSENPVISNSESPQQVAQTVEQKETPTLTAEARLMKEIEEKQKLQEALEKKDKEISGLKNDLKVASQFTQDLNKEVQSIRKDLEDRRKQEARDKFVNLVSISKLYSTSSEEQKNKIVDMLVSSNWSIDQAKEFLGGPEALVNNLQQPTQNFDNQSIQQVPMNTQPSPQTAVASVRHDGTELGKVQTASVQSTTMNGAELRRALQGSYFGRDQS